MQKKELRTGQKGDRMLVGEIGARALHWQRGARKDRLKNEGIRSGGAQIRISHRVRRLMTLEETGTQRGQLQE